MDATFELTLTTRPAVTLAGSLPAHTFALAFEDADALRLHLSNHRLDSEGAVWGHELLQADDALGWVDQVYLEGGADGPRRTTTLRLTGPWDHPPAVHAPEDDAFALTEAWDDATRTLSLTISHNGHVDLAIAWE